MPRRQRAGHQVSCSGAAQIHGSNRAIFDDHVRDESDVAATLLFVRRRAAPGCRIESVGRRMPGGRLAMESPHPSALKIRVAVEKFPFKEPFRITGYPITGAEVLTVEIEANGVVGRGEASGVYYRQSDNPRENAKRIEAIRARLEAGVDRSSLQALLPSGGARNAVDCALWDLEARSTGRSAWQ